MSGEQGLLKRADGRENIWEYSGESASTVESFTQKRKLTLHSAALSHDPRPHLVNSLEVAAQPLTTKPSHYDIEVMPHFTTQCKILVI